MIMLHKYTHTNPESGGGPENFVNLSNMKYGPQSRALRYRDQPQRLLWTSGTKYVSNLRKKRREKMLPLRYSLEMTLT